MTSDYIPQKLADLDTWATNFDTVITATPTSYGLVAGQATAFHTLRLDFTTKLAASSNPATRTSVTVAATVTARNLMVANARQLGQIARKYPAITPTLLSNAGLTVPDPIPTPIPTPTSQPVLGVFNITPGHHFLSFHDAVLTNPRSKPFGVTNLILYRKIVAVGAPAPTSGDFLLITGRMPIDVTNDPADLGKQAYYFAAWSTVKGQVGPISDPLPVIVT